MRIGDVIYDNDTVLIASASFNKEEPCKECFFYDGHECQSNRYIECWDKSINKDLIMIPFENNKVQDSKMMDHSSKTVTSKTGKDLLSALSRLSSITGDETNDMADTASRTLFSSLSMLDINKKFLSLGIRLGVKGAAIRLAIDAMKPIPICSSPCYSISDNRSPEEKHEEEMRFCKDLNDLRCEMLIDMAKKIEEYLL